MYTLAQTTIRRKNADSLLLLFLACAALLLGVAGGASAFPPPGTASDLTLAWSYNGYGQCTVPAQAQSGIIAIAGGGLHSLALTSGGQVLAWGFNNYGQCTVPAQAQSGIVAIAAGYRQSLALTSGGGVLAWGLNEYGQCTVPAQAQSGIVAIAAGCYHSLALTSGSEVLAWGYNGSGQCTVPAQAQSGIVAIAAGLYHSLALTSGGEVLAWGDNTYGECTVPVEAQSGIVAIAAGAGGFNSLALTSGGEVLAWGDNTYGQCTVPAQAQSGIVAIACGGLHSLALTADGEVLAWGDTTYGECTVPAQAQSGIFAIAAGGLHSLALHVADTVSVSLSPPSPATVASGGTTSLSASATDVWGHSLTWSWDNGGAGGLFSPPDSAAPTYTAPGNTTDSDVTISLSATATCAEGASDTQTTTLTVQPVGHSLEVYASADPTAVGSGGATSLTANYTDSRGHGIANWSWSDGGAGGMFSPLDSATPTYTAPANTTGSDLVVTLTVTATCSGASPLSDSATADLTVHPVSPSADFSGAPLRGKSSLAVSFTDLSTGGPTSWAWDFGDGASSTEPSPSHTYTEAGVYGVSLTVTNASGSDTQLQPGYVKASFSDVAITPVDPSDYWALDYILACVRAGIVNGYDDGTYRPTEPVDRASMAVYISRALAGGDEHVPSGPPTATFSDVATDHWAYQWVEYAVANDIVQGYSPTIYGPDVSVDRGQMAVFIARAIVTPTDRPDLPSYTPPETATFSDVATDHWAYKYTEYIAQDSVAVTQGYDDGSYRPDAIVTRDQMAVYVQRAFGLPM